MAIRFELDVEKYQWLPSLEKRIFTKTLYNREFGSIEEALNQEFQGKKVGGFWGFSVGEGDDSRSVYVAFHKGNQWKKLPVFRYYGSSDKLSR